MVIGINTVSSQSGRAYCVDLILRGYTIQGYARHSMHGEDFIKAVNKEKGLFLDRPENSNHEKRTFVSLGHSIVSHDMKSLVENSDYIILAEPSHYFVNSVKEMIQYGLRELKVPLILSPGRTCSSPYLWNLLGDMYPIVCLSTCPYSCKAPDSKTAYIKRRKRIYIASLEGEFTVAQIAGLGEIFHQALFNKVPATTSLGNMGAVFHPAAYLLNYDEIKKAEKEYRDFSFYMEGIANQEKVGEIIQAIDTMRLQIADKMGFKVYGTDDLWEKEWHDIMSTIRNRENEGYNIKQLRRIRRKGLLELNRSIASVYHWLDFTYGVERRLGESLCGAVKRTTTYQKNSVPQWRYVEEDVATGLLPLTKLAERLCIDSSVANEILELAAMKCPDRTKENDRTLEKFSTEYLMRYLKGDFFRVID